MTARSRHQVAKRATRADRTAPDGRVFDSKGEMNRYLELVQQLHRGEIRNLRCQVSYRLVGVENIAIKIVSEHFPNGYPTRYTPDFVYEIPTVESHGLSPVWVEEYEEYKGFDDPLSRFRRAVFEAMMIGRGRPSTFRVKITGPAARHQPSKRR